MPFLSLKTQDKINWCKNCVTEAFCLSFNKSCCKKNQAFGFNSFYPDDGRFIV